ncbi:MAG: hypothetical protein ACM4D3_13070 [Candidatus Sericytochromatia bacterium]
MTTPPMPPPEPPPGGWPPYGPYYGPDPYRRPPRNENSAGVIVGLAVVGSVVYFVVNFVVALLVLMLASDSSTSKAVLATGTVGLALFAFGGGAVLLALRRPWTKGLGLGLMIGWALTSIVTVGFCTGINPSIYGNM